MEKSDNSGALLQCLEPVNTLITAWSKHDLLDNEIQ